MSQINDALNRAEEAHSATLADAAAGPSLPPVAAGADHHRSMEPMVALLVLLMLFTVLAGLFAVQIKRHRIAEAAAAAAAHPVIKVSVAPAPAPPVTITNPPVAPAPAPPAPDPMRLQAIFFDPVHPSALIGGDSMMVGDTVGDFRVSAITPTTVTLVSGARTNILTLSVN